MSGVVIAAVAVLYALFIITPRADLRHRHAGLRLAADRGAARWAPSSSLSIGIIGEYLGRLFLEVKGRPIYVVENVYEDEAPTAPPKA